MAPFAPLGAALRTLRQRGGQTQRQLARAAGLPAGAISRFERGLEQPDAGVLERLLAALGSDLPTLHQTLYAGANPPSRPRSKRSRLGEIEREIRELCQLLDELAQGAAVLFGIATHPRAAAAAPNRKAPAPEVPALPELLEHLHHRGGLDRWAIEPTASELRARPAESADFPLGEHAANANNLADSVARVKKTLRRLRRRISFYQRFS